MSLLHLWRAFSLKNLKEKAKIPLTKGAFVLGCVDETATLRGHFNNFQPPMGLSKDEQAKYLPEIFIQVTDPQTGQRKVIEQVCFIARNPSLHRGDIRVVKAVDVPALHHLCDVLVMPQTGDRDLSSMCAGGDLDGDDYIVCWDEDLIPSVWNVEPFHYNSPPPKTAPWEITTADIINFFVDYLQNDALGRIAHAHLAAADYYVDGIQSSQCLELVQLHSIAVDYPKTGIPAQLPLRLERNVWPHFMQKRGRPYHSGKILGQLYDAVECEDFAPDWQEPFDSRILKFMKPSNEMMQGAKALKHDYDIALQRIMAQHKIKTEFEVWSTFVISHSKAGKDYKFHEEIGQLSKTLKDQHYEAICGFVGGKDFDQLVPFAIAAYHYTHKQLNVALEEVDTGERELSTEGMPFISWPWLLQDVLIRIAASVENLPTSRVMQTNKASIFLPHGKPTHDVLMKRYDKTENRDTDSSSSPKDDWEIGLGSLREHLPDPYQPPETA